MVNNQVWFNNYYPKTKQEINLEYEDFWGQLLIENYPNLEELYLLNIKSINELVIKDLPKLKDCTILNCNTKNLVIENCPQIRKLNVRNNLLTSLEFLRNLENIGELDLNISCNDFLESNLESFSKLGNLKGLNISNLPSRKFIQSRYNRFIGSLEPLSPLKNTNKLKKLDISITNINDGLEHLPESLEEIICASERISLTRPSKCSEIVRQLKNYPTGNNSYDLTRWRNRQPYHRDIRELTEIIAHKDIEIAQIELAKKQREEELLNLLTRNHSQQIINYSGNFTSYGTMLNGQSQFGNQTTVSSNNISNYQTVAGGLREEKLQTQIEIPTNK